MGGVFSSSFFLSYPKQKSDCAAAKSPFLSFPFPELTDEIGSFVKLIGWDGLGPSSSSPLPGTAEVPLLNSVIWGTDFAAQRYRTFYNHALRRNTHRYGSSVPAFRRRRYVIVHSVAFRTSLPMPTFNLSVGTPTAIGGESARCRAVLETRSEERTVEECLPICKAGEKNFDCGREVRAKKPVYLSIFAIYGKQYMS